MPRPRRRATPSQSGHAETSVAPPARPTASSRSAHRAGREALVGPGLVVGTTSPTSPVWPSEPSSVATTYSTSSGSSEEGTRRRPRGRPEQQCHAAAGLPRPRDDGCARVAGPMSATTSRCRLRASDLEAATEVGRRRRRCRRPAARDSARSQGRDPTSSSSVPRGPVDAGHRDGRRQKATWRGVRAGARTGLAGRVEPGLGPDRTSSRSPGRTSRDSMSCDWLVVRMAPSRRGVVTADRGRSADRDEPAARDGRPVSAVPRRSSSESSPRLVLVSSSGATPGTAPRGPRPGRRRGRWGRRTGPSPPSVVRACQVGSPSSSTSGHDLRLEGAVGPVPEAFVLVVEDEAVARARRRGLPTSPGTARGCRASERWLRSWKVSARS